MNEFIEFIKNALRLKTVSESTEMNTICPGGISQGMLGGRIQSRYGVYLTNTEISRCHTVTELKKKIDVKRTQQLQARDNDGCSMSRMRTNMINLH